MEYKQETGSRKPPATGISNKVSPALPRKGLSDKGRLSHQQLIKMLPQDKTWGFGRAIDNGDCFYDAIAQSLDARATKSTHTLKSLRKICSDYLYQLNAQSSEANWVKEAIEKGKEVDDYQTHLTSVQFTQEEMTEHKKGKMFTGYAIWGKPHIEGKILAQQLKISLHIIEFHEAGSGMEAVEPTHILVTEDKVTQVEKESINYQYEQMIHLAVYRDHFVPILSSRYLKQQQSNPEDSWQEMIQFNKDSSQNNENPSQNKAVEFEQGKVDLINSRYWYQDNDISEYIDVVIHYIIGGYRKGYHFLLTGTDDGCFPDNDNNRYLVAVTPTIDTVNHAAPLDSWLDKSKQPAPVGERDERRDVWDEIMPLIIKQQKCNVKVLFGYNDTLIHWLLGEIQLHKTKNHYTVILMAHDPYGGGEVDEKNFAQLSAATKQGICQKDPLAQLEFKHQPSPYGRRQSKGDLHSCGVIVSEDMLKRIQGASLDRKEPYPLGTEALRRKHLQAFKEHLPEKDATRRNFIKRTTQVHESRPFIPAFSFKPEKTLLDITKIVSLISAIQHAAIKQRLIEAITHRIYQEDKNAYRVGIETALLQWPVELLSQGEQIEYQDKLYINELYYHLFLGKEAFQDQAVLIHSIASQLTVDMSRKLEQKKENVGDLNELFNSIRRFYFGKALTEIESLTQSITAKPLLYLLGYDQEPKTVKTLFKRLQNDLNRLWGKENIICPVISLKSGDSTFRTLSKIKDCKVIIVLCTPALQQAYDQVEKDHLANQELNMVFTQLVKQKSKVIPFYLNSKDNVLFFLEDLTPALLETEKAYQKGVFLILEKLVEDKKLQKAIRVQQKKIEQVCKDSKTLSLEKQQSLLNQLRQKQASEQKAKEKDTYCKLVSEFLGQEQESTASLITVNMRELSERFDPITMASTRVNQLLIRVKGHVYFTVGRKPNQTEALQVLELFNQLLTLLKSREFADSDTKTKLAELVELVELTKEINQFEDLCLSGTNGKHFAERIQKKFNTAFSEHSKKERDKIQQVDLPKVKKQKEELESQKQELSRLQEEAIKTTREIEDINEKMSQASEKKKKKYQKFSQDHQTNPLVQKIRQQSKDLIERILDKETYNDEELTKLTEALCLSNEKQKVGSLLVLAIKRNDEQLFEKLVEYADPKHKSDGQSLLYLVAKINSKDSTRSFALLKFSQDEISRLKEQTKKAMLEANNLNEQLIQKIQDISLKDADWTKVEFGGDEVKRLKEFLDKNGEANLSAKLLSTIREKIIDILGDSAEPTDIALFNEAKHKLDLQRLMLKTFKRKNFADETAKAEFYKELLVAMANSEPPEVTADVEQIAEEIEKLVNGEEYFAVMDRVIRKNPSYLFILKGIHISRLSLLTQLMVAYHQDEMEEVIQILANPELNFSEKVETASGEHISLFQKFRSYALLNFSQEEISLLKEHTKKEAIPEGNSLNKQLIQKIQDISLKDSDWTKVEFEQIEVKRLKEFLDKKGEASLSAKLPKLTTWKTYESIKPILLKQAVGWLNNYDSASQVEEDEFCYVDMQLLRHSLTDGDENNIITSVVDNLQQHSKHYNDSDFEELQEKIFFPLLAEENKKAVVHAMIDKLFYNLYITKKRVFILEIEEYLQREDFEIITKMLDACEKQNIDLWIYDIVILQHKLAAIEYSEAEKNRSRLMAMLTKQKSDVSYNGQVAFAYAVLGLKKEFCQHIKDNLSKIDNEGLAVCLLFSMLYDQKELVDILFSDQHFTKINTLDDIHIENLLNVCCGVEIKKSYKEQFLSKLKETNQAKFTKLMESKSAVECLHKTIKVKDFEFFQLLLEHGVDPNATYEKYLPLERSMLTTSKSFLEPIQEKFCNELIKQGADPQKEGRDNKTMINNIMEVSNNSAIYHEASQRSKQNAEQTKVIREFSAFKL